jgi:hypothetical protein
MTTEAQAPDLATQYANVCSNIAILEEQRSQIDVQINSVTADQESLQESHAQQMKSLSAQRLKLRQDRETASRQIENLRKVRDSLATERKVQDHVQAAEAARVAAEAQKTEQERITAELAEKNRAADELIAKLQKQAEAGETKE